MSQGDEAREKELERLRVELENEQRAMQSFLLAQSVEWIKSMLSEDIKKEGPPPLEGYKGLKNKNASEILEELKEFELEDPDEHVFKKVFESGKEALLNSGKVAGKDTKSLRVIEEVFKDKLNKKKYRQEEKLRDELESQEALLEFENKKSGGESQSNEAKRYREKIAQIKLDIPAASERDRQNAILDIQSSGIQSPSEEQISEKLKEEEFGFSKEQKAHFVEEMQDYRNGFEGQLSEKNSLQSLVVDAAKGWIVLSGMEKLNEIDHGATKKRMCEIIDAGIEVPSGVNVFDNQTISQFITPFLSAIRKKGEVFKGLTAEEEAKLFSIALKEYQEYTNAKVRNVTINESAEIAAEKSLKKNKELSELSDRISTRKESMGPEEMEKKSVRTFADLQAEKVAAQSITEMSNQDWGARAIRRAKEIIGVANYDRQKGIAVLKDPIIISFYRASGGTPEDFALLFAKAHKKFSSPKKMQEYMQKQSMSYFFNRAFDRTDDLLKKSGSNIVLSEKEKKLIRKKLNPKIQELLPIVESERLELIQTMLAREMTELAKSKSLERDLNYLNSRMTKGNLKMYDSPFGHEFGERVKGNGRDITLEEEKIIYQLLNAKLESLGEGQADNVKEGLLDALVNVSSAWKGNYGDKEFSDGASKALEQAKDFLVGKDPALEASASMEPVKEAAQLADPIVNKEFQAELKKLNLGLAPEQEQFLFKEYGPIVSNMSEGLGEGAEEVLYKIIAEFVGIAKDDPNQTLDEVLRGESFKKELLPFLEAAANDLSVPDHALEAQAAKEPTQETTASRASSFVDEGVDVSETDNLDKKAQSLAKGALSKFYFLEDDLESEIKKFAPLLKEKINEFGEGNIEKLENAFLEALDKQVGVEGKHYQDWKNVDESQLIAFIDNEKAKLLKGESKDQALYAQEPDEVAKKLERQDSGISVSSDDETSGAAGLPKDVLSKANTIISEFQRKSAAHDMGVGNALKKSVQKIQNPSAGRSSDV